MRYLILLVILFFSLSIISAKNTTLHYETLYDLNCSTNRSDTKYHAWKPMCFYMNETSHNSTVNTTKCMEMIDFMFDEHLMRAQLYNNNCDPKECFIKMMSCVKSCSEHKILECAECIGKMYFDCCDCVFPENICV